MKNIEMSLSGHHLGFLITTNCCISRFISIEPCELKYNLVIHQVIYVVFRCLVNPVHFTHSYF